MKKIYSFMVAAVAMIAAVSCNKEFSNDNLFGGDVITFRASVDGADTKAILNGKKSSWEADDKITIHNGENGYEFMASAAGEAVNFTYDNMNADFEGNRFIAIYPSGNYTTVDVVNKTINASIPLKQYSPAGSYDPSAVIAMSYTETNELLFKNAVALLKFTIKMDDVQYVEFVTNGTEQVSGDVKITLVETSKGDFETNVECLGGNTKLTCYPEKGNKHFENGKTYYAAVAPQTFAEGVKFFASRLKSSGSTTLYENEIIRNTSNSVVTKANTILDLGDIGGMGYTTKPTVETIYLKPNADWLQDKAWFAAHFFNSVGGSEDVKMTESIDYPGLYEVVVPDGAEKVVICRMNPNYSGFSWDEGHVWNQIDDTTIPLENDEKVCFSITDWTKGSWITIEEATYVPEVVPSDYGVVGSFQGWAPENSTEMFADVDGWIVARSLELYKDDELKFVKGTTWDESYGAGGNSTVVVKEDEDLALVNNGQNIRVAKNGKHDVYFNPTTKKFKYECVEEYTDIEVNITIDNKANWSPLTISIWNGGTKIVDNATVTGNKFSISGDYIGASLKCKLSSGTKTSAELPFEVTKNGATVTLEEKIIKLKVQLDTQNSKQWWGNTMKIHVWNTGTSFDTTWPGTTMTSEGNYTWSIVVPSELIGKTINYLINNGGDWKSNDSNVTISAEGNTVKGSSIGIN